MTDNEDKIELKLSHEKYPTLISVNKQFDHKKSLLFLFVM